MDPANSSAVRFPASVAVLIATLVTGLATGGGASAAQKTLSWDDDAACTFRIRFDPKKHDENRLKNTIRLLFSPHDLRAPIVPLVPDPAAIATVDLGKFDQQCSDLLRTVREMELARFPGIEDYRRTRIGEIEDSCRFGNVQIRGLRDPSVLREYTRAPACAHFIDALEGKSDMMKVYQETVTRQCSNNASPQRCRDRHLGDAQKPDGEARVRLYLTTFSWNNCANNNAARDADSKVLDRMRAGLDKLFRRTFAVRSKCENPG